MIEYIIVITTTTTTTPEQSRAKHQRNCTKISRVFNFFFVHYVLHWSVFFYYYYSFVFIFKFAHTLRSLHFVSHSVMSLFCMCSSLFPMCACTASVFVCIMCCWSLPSCSPLHFFALLCFGLHMYACVCASVCVALHFLRCCLPANAHLAWCTPDCYYSILSLLFTYVYILACFASCVSVCVCIILVFLLRRFSCMETLIKWMRIFVFCVAACRRHVRCQYFVFYFFFRYVSIFLSLYRCVFAFHFIIIAVELQWIGKR